LKITLFFHPIKNTDGMESEPYPTQFLRHSILFLYRLTYFLNTMKITQKIYRKQEKKTENFPDPFYLSSDLMSANPEVGCRRTHYACGPVSHPATRFACVESASTVTRSRNACSLKRKRTRRRDRRNARQGEYTGDGAMSYDKVPTSYPPPGMLPDA
jgi:hypothetical protein